MRGSMFLAVLLLVLGVILLTVVLRGRTRQLIDAFTSQSTQGRVGSRSAQTTRQPRSK